MPRKSIAVIVAMRRELAPLLRGVQGRRLEGIEFFELGNAVVAVGGIGRDAARRTTEAVVAEYSPGEIISAGLAGALSPALKIGAIIRSRGAVDAESGVIYSVGGDARVVTASSVGGPAEKRTIAQRWRFAEVVDMEASAVAEITERRGIGFAALKAVSDELEFAMPPLGDFVDHAGGFQTLRFATYLAVHPKWWGAVWRLNSNSRVASVKLSEALKHLIDRESLNSSSENVVGAMVP